MKYKISIILFLIITSMIFSFMPIKVNAVGGGWLVGFIYRKSHVINSAVGAGSDYQIKIIVYYGSGSDSLGNVYLNSLSQTDFDDIRFSDDDGVTPLSYWLESKIDSTSAIFWVKVNDSLESTSQTIYIYYGNNLVSTTSSGVNTFIFFEDGNSISEWTSTYGTWSASGGVIHQTDDTISTSWGNGLKITSPPSTDGRMISVNMKIVSTSGNRYVGFSGKWLDADNYLHIEFRKESTPLIRCISYIYGYGWGIPYNYNFDMEYSAFHRLTIGISSSGVVESWIDNTLAHSFVNTDWDKTWTNINLHTFNTKANFDDIFVGKYVYPQPSHGTWGAQEKQIFYVTLYFIASHGYVYVNGTRMYNQTQMSGQTNSVKQLLAVPKNSTYYFKNFNITNLQNMYNYTFISRNGSMWINFGLTPNYTLGYLNGYSVGYIVGNNTGYLLGLSIGNNTGYYIGYIVGNYTGYSLGYSMLKPSDYFITTLFIIPIFTLSLIMIRYKRRKIG